MVLRKDRIQIENSGMIIIRGKVTEGFGLANETVKRQMPFFAKDFPEIKDCYPATINVELEHALHIWNPDHTTSPIPWTGVPPGERFGFLRIRFECPLKSAARQAWVYIPHASPHYHKLVVIEVLTEWVENLKYEMPCQICIARDHRELPVIVV